MQNQDATAAFNALGHELRLNVFRLIVQRAGQGVTPSEGRHLIYSPAFEFMNALIGFLSENCCDGSPCVLSRPVTVCRKEP